MNECELSLLCEDGVATIELSRPDRLNAINERMLQSLMQMLDRVEADPVARVLVIRGAGRMFSSGADVGSWSALSPYAMGSQWIRLGNAVFNRIERLDIPSIALMSGSAFGGGLELALACDLRYASPDVELALPEVRLGAVAGWNGCSRLVQVVGLGRAREIALLGESITAETALRWGLINGLFPADQLCAAVTAICKTLASRSPSSLAVSKQVLRAVSGDARDVIHEFAASLCKTTSDATEGVAAFHDKRQPVFRKTE